MRSPHFFCPPSRTVLGRWRRLPPRLTGPILVKEIGVQGNRRVQEAVILGRVGAKIGTPFVANRTAEDIRAIFSLGFFDDVQVKVEDFEGGVKLTFVVVERPFVRDIVFAGNKKQDAADPPGEDRAQAGQRLQPGGGQHARAEKLKESTRRRATSRSASPPRSRSSPTGT